MSNTKTTHTHSFAAGFITASIFFMIPVLLVPDLRAEFIDTSIDYSTQDIDMDGIDDAYDTEFEFSASSPMPGVSGDDQGDDDDDGFSSSSYSPFSSDDNDDQGDDDDDGFSSSSFSPFSSDDNDDQGDDDMGGDTGGDFGGDTGGDIENNTSSAGFDCDDDGFMDDPCDYACWEDMNGDGIMDDPCS